MKLRIEHTLALALAACGMAHAAPFNLVTNGSFEQGAGNIGSFQGWAFTAGDPSTFVDSNGQTGTNYGQATDGKWAAYFGSTAASGGASISQSLATTTGQFYTLSFDLANDNAGSAPMNSFMAYLGGTTVFSRTNLASQNFVHNSVLFQATGTSTPLRFFASNDQSYVELDNVAVVVATPEPSPALLLMSGTLFCAALTWKLRQTASKIA